MHTTEKLVSMLTENTGRSILDSGGAYGRNWERNQGLTLDMWDNMPTATFDSRWGQGNINVYYWLKERLTYAPVMDRLFRIFSADSDESHLADAEAFAEHMGETRIESYNSYNWENYLSQDIQWVDFEYGGEAYVLLQIHGGCDARGGYTKPVVFKPYSEFWYGDMHDMEYFCTSRVPIVSERMTSYKSAIDGVGTVYIPVLDMGDCSWYMNARGSDYTTNDGDYMDSHDVWEILSPKDGPAVCPICKRESISVSAPEACY